MTIILIRPGVIRFGAEELDAECLERNIGAVVDNLTSFKLDVGSSLVEVTVWNSGEVVDRSQIILNSAQGLKSRFVNAFIGDPASRHYLRLGFAEAIESYLEERSFIVEAIITSNSSLLGVSLSLPTKRRITRSVNFEPLHYLQENKYSVKTPIVFALKIWSTIIEAMFSEILPISPRDKKLYGRLGLRRIGDVLPLQHLRGNQARSDILYKPTLRVGFLGSTYSVKHNRECFTFVVTEVAPMLIGQPIQFNIYGVKSPKLEIPSNLKVHGWVDSISEIYENNDVFIVPFFGGTGQQSKLFEPICAGKIVVADPKAFAGYPFKHGIHYLAASSSLDFVKTLISISKGESDLTHMSFQSQELANALFNPESYRLFLSEFLKTSE